MPLLEAEGSDGLAMPLRRDEEGVGEAHSIASVIRETELAVRPRHRSDIAAQLACPHGLLGGLRA
jgi:hypothetical protein